MLDNSWFHLVPSLNPDGAEKAFQKHHKQRRHLQPKCTSSPGADNANGIDLDTDFASKFIFVFCTCLFRSPWDVKVLLGNHFFFFT